MGLGVFRHASLSEGNGQMRRDARGSATRVSGAVNDAGACVSNAVASATPESSSSTRAAA
ncbi:Uncharacterised protein [Bordetella pertussis]|nr:Uncharacterised protein [Bordetella pertussis]